MKLLTDKIQNGTGLLNQTTLNQLKRKHLQGKQTDFITILADTSEEIHLINFDWIGAELLKRAAARARSKAGPLRIDADFEEKVWLRNSLVTYVPNYVQPLMELFRNYPQHIISHHF